MAPARARAAVSDWLAQATDDGRLVDDALLIVSELVSNCVRHAHIEGNQPLHLRGSLAAGAMRLELWNAGTEGTVAARRPQQGNDVGGFGLNLVARLSRDWGVDRDAHGTTVWLELPTAAVETT